MWRTSSGRRKLLPSTMRLPGPRLLVLRGAAMELFTTLFSDLLVFVYHCFDRIVIHGYLSGLSRPEQVVHFFRQVVGAPVVSKELLSQRTSDYQNWVEAFARNHKLPIQWAEKGVRKEDYVQPWLRRMVRKDVYGVYFTVYDLRVTSDQARRESSAPAPAGSARDRTGRARGLSYNRVNRRTR